MDTWHKAKLLKKVLANVSLSMLLDRYHHNVYDQAGQLKGMSKIALCSQNIVNHFWYSCRTCNGNLTTLKVATLVCLEVHPFYIVRMLGEVERCIASCMQ